MAHDLATLKDWFEASEDSSYEARQRSERDRDYYDGIQLTAEQKEELRRRGQPAVIVNRIRRKVEWLKGLEATRRTDPKAFPRTPQHAQGAEAATDALRFVCDNTEWQTKRSMIWEDMLVEGTGACEVVHEETKRGTEVVVNHYHWNRTFVDPHSRQKDASDARYMGAVIWMDHEDAKLEWGSKAKDLADMVSRSNGQTYDDIPRYKQWVSKDRKRVRIVLMWYKEKNDWKWKKFSDTVDLAGGVSPYVDETGESLRTFFIQSTFVDREGNRYGVVRDMIDPQDEINKRRSKALFQNTSRQTAAPKGSLASIDEMKEELAKPDGHVEYRAGDNGEKFEVLPQNDQIQGHLSLMQEAKDEIDMMGASSALAGETGESASGRAVLARQQGGMIEIASVFDGLYQLSRQVYRAMWMIVRQTWTEERWIRVTDDDRNTRFVGLNRPIRERDFLRDIPDNIAFQIAAQQGYVPGDPRLDEVIGVANNVETMDVDIVLEEVPDEVSLQGETFDALVKLAPVIGETLAGPYAQLLIETAPLRTEAKDRLLEGIEQTQQTQAPMKGAMVEAEARKAIAEAAQAEQLAQAPQLAVG